MFESNVTLAPPWTRLHRTAEALFAKDKDVTVEWDEDEMLLTFRVVGSLKAEQLEAKLPGSYTFGTVVVRTRVVPANAEEPDAFRAIFEGNEAVKFVERRDMLPLLPRTFIVFNLEDSVVQFLDDDISDYYHVCTTLLEDAARTVFPDAESVSFCTSILGSDE